MGGVVSISEERPHQPTFERRENLLCGSIFLDIDYVYRINISHKAQETIDVLFALCDNNVIRKGQSTGDHGGEDW